MICEHCKGPIDVPCHNGKTLRCGCGRTMMPGGAAGHGDLRSLLAVLRENRVVSYAAAGVVITLSPDSWREAAPVMEPIPPDEMCTCGHAIHDHTQAGCVHGCDIETCGREEKAA